ncbi:sensor domain-containing diguanylate cyclase [Shewanella acanthi]|uniref:sensor domain-containing diguanylate cyclase n=1 Tax=Shewanella acanthi TaxID=2864212 RepID=UPI001C65FB7A|nr:sensor domain-containing diguanylate cyclase [Shewanella acanthi]QYJ77748.1 diguanylate cyclase [Shewanella acanthi]
MIRLSANDLWLYYRRIMILGASIFLGVVWLTLWTGWHRQEAVEIERAKQQVFETALHLEAVIKTARDQVTQLTQWSNEFINHTPYVGSEPLQQTLAKAIAQSIDGAFTLDTLDNRPAKDRLGQIIALTSANDPIPPYEVSPANLAASLLDRMSNGQMTSDFLRWTYFFSANEDLLALTPWVSSQDALGTAPSIELYLQSSWKDYEVTRLGLPSNNPERKPYWTAAYIDQAGAGLMVSHAQPVYWEEKFIGIVATDVLLNFLNELLKTFPDPEGTLLINNEHNQILANREDTEPKNTTIANLSSILPVDLSTTNSLDKMNGLYVDENLLLASSLENPRWTIVFLLPKSLIRQRILKSYSSQLQLSLALIIAVVVINLILWHMYVAPSLRVARFVASYVTQTTSSPPKVPQAWIPWVNELVQAFSERRRLFQELERNNAALERKVAARTHELQKANEQLARQANTDALTGVYNRRFLLELLENETERVRRGESPLAVLMLDLDYFKRVNDKHGHDAGDAVLCEFTERALSCIRKIDRLCRYGGEEFAVVLPSCIARDALEIAERLRHKVAATPIEHAGINVSITVSIGVAQFHIGDNAESLLKRADDMLYLAKVQGRNQVVYLPD